MMNTVRHYDQSCCAGYFLPFPFSLYPLLFARWTLQTSPFPSVFLIHVFRDEYCRFGLPGHLLGSRFTAVFFEARGRLLAEGLHTFLSEGSWEWENEERANEIHSSGRGILNIKDVIGIESALKMCIRPKSTCIHRKSEHRCSSLPISPLSPSLPLTQQIKAQSHTTSTSQPRTECKRTRHSRRSRRRPS